MSNILSSRTLKILFEIQYSTYNRKIISFSKHCSYEFIIETDPRLYPKSDVLFVVAKFKNEY